MELLESCEFVIVAACVVAFVVFVGVDVAVGNDDGFGSFHLPEKMDSWELVFIFKKTFFL
jgi:hypothetical protein